MIQRISHKAFFLTEFSQNRYSGAVNLKKILVSKGKGDWIMPVHFVKQISSGLNL